MANWITRFLNAIATHKADVSAHHAKTSKASEITSERFPVDRLPAMTDEKIWKGTGGNVEEIDVPVAPGYGRLTLKGFQFNAATGTATDPINLTDNNVATNIVMDAVNEYVEILLPAALKITQFRYYGWVNHAGNGRYKIQYLDVNESWQDWVTDIPTRLATWSDWDSSGGTVTALAIRWIATTMDTFKNHTYELEVKY